MHIGPENVLTSMTALEAITSTLCKAFTWARL